MIHEFAALRFTGDENLADRVYWYLTEFPVCVGEAVFAPVGPHDKLQLARVERTLAGEEAHAPYDVRLMKRVTARYGDRTPAFGETSCTEFGGLKYDGRHFTAYHVLVYAEEMPSNADMVGGYGLDRVMKDEKIDGRAVFEALIRGHGVLLVGGDGKEICRTLLDFLRGKPAAEACLREAGLDAAARAALFDALTRQRAFGRNA